MGAPVGITRTDFTSGELRALSGRCSDGAQVRRILAVAMVLEGRDRTQAAELNGMDRQTLRDWIHRYNAGSVEGLVSRRSPGRTRALNSLQQAQLLELVLAGPDPEINGVVRWRCVDLQAEVERRFGVKAHGHTVARWLNELGLTRLQPRPYHPRKDPLAETEFKKKFSDLVKAALSGTALSGPVEIWFQDEARVGQKGGHAYIWAPVGSRPLMVRDNRYVSTYIFGAICPGRAVGAAMIMPYANTEAMNEHLKEISLTVAPGAHAILVCDGAGWHQRGVKLKVPGNITLLSLPPYSPELNPMENVWDYLRQNKLCAQVWDTYEDILEACKNAWNFLIDDPDRIRSIGNRDWACVNV